MYCDYDATEKDKVVKENAGNDVTAKPMNFEINLSWKCFILPTTEICKKCLLCPIYRDLQTYTLRLCILVLLAQLITFCFFLCVCVVHKAWQVEQCRKVVRLKEYLLNLRRVSYFM